MLSAALRPLGMVSLKIKLSFSGYSYYEYMSNEYKMHPLNL